MGKRSPHMQDFRRHLINAIRLNGDRKERYAELTDDRSLPFSIQLIVWQKLSLPVAWYFDHVGDQYQQKGVPFIKAEMADFDTVPEFSATYPPGIDYWEPFEKHPVNALKQSIRRALVKNDFDAVFELCDLALVELSVQVHLHCCLRYILESIRKSAFLVRYHQSLSIQLGVEPPTRYVRQFIQAHLWIIEQAQELDANAAIIQNAGVPFLFQDFPWIDLDWSFDYNEVA